MTDSQGALAARADDCRRAVADFLISLERVEPRLQAFVQVDPDRLAREAAALDALAPRARGPLHGLIVAVKEIFDVAGYVCAWGSPIQQGRRPPRDAWAVARLRDAGALIAGITVSMEYAIAAPGPTVNPHDGGRTPGGSSQGSAAAVGAGLLPAALASQTIGSIVRPAAYCGCLGMKPSWGTIDLAGCMPLSGALDHVGFTASDVAVARRLLPVLAPSLDIGCHRVPDRIVLLDPWYGEATAPVLLDALDRAAGRLSEAGLRVEREGIPDWIARSEAMLLDTILAHDIARHHGGDYDRHASAMSSVLRDYIERGRLVSEADYSRALLLRRDIAECLDALIGEDVALAPSIVDIAPKRACGTGSRAAQRLWSVGGQPALGVPLGAHAGLPLGVQLIAARGRDHALLAVAELLREDGPGVGATA